MVRTVKFGGTSLADAQMMKRCADIIHSDASRRYIVVSAPGKRNPEDVKVTDLLYRLYAEKYSGREYVDTLYQIRDRFEEMICDLGIAFDLSAEMEEIRTGLEHLPGSDWLASRGEYLNAKIFAAYLGVPFVDAAVLIRLNVYRIPRIRLDQKRYVQMKMGGDITSVLFMAVHRQHLHRKNIRSCQPYMLQTAFFMNLPQCHLSKITFSVCMAAQPGPGLIDVMIRHKHPRPIRCHHPGGSGQMRSGILPCVNISAAA